jgi:hypothetical protein
VSYPPPPEPSKSIPPPSAPAGIYSPDGRWYWSGQQWQPVQPAVAPGPPWARPYGPPDGLAAAAVALVAVATAGSGLLLLGEGLDLVAALVATGSAIELVGGVVVLLGEFAFLVGLIGGAISVAMWMHRAYRNLPALGAQGLHWTPGWAAGAWFIPFANFVIPLLVMRELWTRVGGDPEPPSPLLPVWWAAWLGGYAVQLASNQAARFSRAGGDVLGMLNDLATLAAGILLILIIQAITRRQRARYAQLHSA